MSSENNTMSSENNTKNPLCNILNCSYRCEEGDIIRETYRIGSNNIVCENTSDNATPVNIPNKDKYGPKLTALEAGACVFYGTETIDELIQRLENCHSLNVYMRVSSYKLLWSLNNAFFFDMDRNMWTLTFRLTGICISSSGFECTIPIESTIQRYYTAHITSGADGLRVEFITCDQ
jgi:hypothetical protein